jgi:hypothetical protein
VDSIINRKKVVVVDIELNSTRPNGRVKWFKSHEETFLNLCPNPQFIANSKRTQLSGKWSSIPGSRVGSLRLNKEHFKCLVQNNKLSIHAISMEPISQHLMIWFEWGLNCLPHC